MPEQPEDSAHRNNGYSRPVAVAAIVICMFAILAWSIHRHSPALGNSSASAKQATPSDASKAADADSPNGDDLCDRLLQRQQEIDSGSSNQDDKPIAPIDPRHLPPEYTQLKQCWRSRMSEPKPTVMYNGASFRSNLQLGMTMKQVAQALPMMTPDIANLPFDPTPLNNPRAFDWVQEKCVAPNNPHSRTAITCVLVQPLSFSPKMRELSHAPLPDTLMADFDKNAPDGKLLGWNFTYSLPVESYKTSDSVLRYIRKTDFDYLGPPDIASPSSASWSFNDPTGKELLSVSVLVQRRGMAFVADVSVFDNENGDIAAR